MTEDRSSDAKISILVAIYNIEKYIAKCIESIINQSYKNIEIILIDDGSTDSSYKIVDEYAKKDERIIILHKNNGGVSSARNAGLDAACGNYIVFVDGDDWLSSDFAEYMLKVICDTKSDFAISTNNFTTRNSQQVYEDKIETWTPEKATAEFLYPRLSIGAWNKIYKRDFINKNNLRFRTELYMGEGLRFITDAAQRANHIGVGRRKVYYYRLNNAESATTKLDVRQGTGSRYAVEGIKRDLILNTPEVLNAVNWHIWKNNCFTLRLIIATHSHKKNIKVYTSLYRECIKNIRRDAFRIMMKSDLPFKSKIKIPLRYLAPSMIAIYENYRLAYKLKRDKTE